MHIPVPVALQAVVMNGNLSPLTELRNAHTKLVEAQASLVEVRAKAESCIDASLGPVLAQGLAHSQLGPSQVARMVILPTGELMVEVTGGATPSFTTPAVISARRSRSGGTSQVDKTTGALVGPAAYPSIGELRAQAKAVGADIRGVSPQNKRAIIEIIEAAGGVAPTVTTAAPVIMAAPAVPQVDSAEDPEVDAWLAD